MDQQTTVATDNGAVYAKQKTCFVVTGFGRKTDYATGRVLDLDKTYEQLIRPAFDRVNINAFRAIDANLTGSIDSLMYEWIYHADVVIADLSTLNANVFYELGVRHAQRPNTTIIIAESVLMERIPFDLSSFVVHQYVHGGDEIPKNEQTRFVDHLAGVLQEIIDVENKRLSEEGHLERQDDSPVFTFLKGITPPAYQSGKSLQPPVYTSPNDREDKPIEAGDSIGSMLEAAEVARAVKEFERAIELFDQAIEKGRELKENNEGKAAEYKPDIFLVQRKALVTYKHGEARYDKGEIDKAEADRAMRAAERILEEHCAPNISTDPETLGLSGAINKRRSEYADTVARRIMYLDRAIAFYERGFYVKQDYYNGINVAFMYNERALMMDNQFDAIVSFGHAQMIRKKVAEICNGIITATEFHQRGDRHWVYFTLAEAYFGQKMRSEAEEALEKARDIAKEVNEEFAIGSYERQEKKLRDAIDAFSQKFGDLNGSGGLSAAVSPTEPPVTTELVESSTEVETAPIVEARAGQAGPVQPIVIDANIARERLVRSVEVNVKIDYN